MRYVGTTSMTFADLGKLIGKSGPVHAIQVDHLRGIIRIVHHSVKGVQDGAQPVDHFYEYKEPNSLTAHLEGEWEKFNKLRRENGCRQWQFVSPGKAPVVFWLYPFEGGPVSHLEDKWTWPDLAGCGNFTVAMLARCALGMEADEPLQFCRGDQNAFPHHTGFHRADVHD